jgi:predicted nucleotidyltransferase component of viral defense system
MPLETRTFAVEGRWFTGRVSIGTYALEELLGTKLRALYQRKKGRDLFDLATALEQVPSLALDRIAECFGRYLGHNDQRVSRAEFEQNLTAKLEDLAFTQDIGPLLVPGTEDRYDVHRAGERIWRELVSRVPGGPWKGPGASGDIT